MNTVFSLHSGGGRYSYMVRTIPTGDLSGTFGSSEGSSRAQVVANWGKALKLSDFNKFCSNESLQIILQYFKCKVYP